MHRRRTGILRFQAVFPLRRFEAARRRRQLARQAVRGLGQSGDGGFEKPMATVTRCPTRGQIT